MHPTAQFPILIVGAGPVGLSLALGLLRRGLAVLVFERRPALAQDPRATTIQPPTLEMLEHLGVLDAVAARSRRVETLAYHDWVKPERIAKLPLLMLAHHTPHPFRLHCAQPDLCQVLYDAIEALQPGTVQLGTTLVSFKDRGDCVDAKLQHKGRKRSVRGTWLCAADGMKSSVRKALDIPVRKVGKKDVFFTCEVGLEVDDLHREHFGTVLEDASYLFTNLGWALFMRMPDSVRLLLLLDDGSKDAMSNANLERVRATLFGWKSDLPLHNRALYKVQQQYAASWHRGRVILLGDAAHITFPVNGTAMNSGIHDGFTLSKVLLSDGDVESWARERQQIVERRVGALANSTYQALGATGLFSTFTRNRHLRKLEAGGDPLMHHLLRNSMLEHRAKDAPVLT